MIIPIFSITSERKDTTSWQNNQKKLPLHPQTCAAVGASMEAPTAAHVCVELIVNLLFSYEKIKFAYVIVFS